MTSDDAICSECGRLLGLWHLTESRCPLHPKARPYYLDDAGDHLRVVFR